MTWRPEDVENMVTNPIYTGIGPFERLVSDDAFVKAGKKAIQEMGAEKYLRLLLKNLRASFDEE